MKEIGLLTKALSAFLLVGFASQANAKTVSQTLVAEHAIAQQGLGLGVASTTFFNQFAMLLDPAFATIGTCYALSGGTHNGGITLVSFKQNGKDTKETEQANFYFDASCKKPYVVASSQYDRASQTESVGKVVLTYTGVTGFALGTFNVKAAEGKSGNNLEISGIGTFTPSSGVSADVGFACEIKGLFSGNGAAQMRTEKTTIPCSYAIAQKFPSLGQSVASMTTMKLKSTFEGAGAPVKFDGVQSETVTSPNELTVISPALYKLAINGKNQTSFGTAAPQGSAAGFEMFPPKPTTWSITDTAHDIAFTTAVTDKNTRASAGTITQISTGTTLATFTVDQSGTGSIKYSDGSTAAITSWLLSN